MRELFVTNQFRKDATKIPTSVRNQADSVVSKLRENPTDSSLNTKKLAKVTPSTYRVRIGHYRLIFSFTKNSLILHRFRHRKDVYRD